MANEGIKVIRRAVPPDVPGWVRWLLGLDQSESNKNIVWIILFGSAVVVAAALNTVPVPGERRLTIAGAWAITVATVLIILAALGMQRLFRVGGILISERNLMSLTRFQITAWTVMIGSAILAVGLGRAFHPEINAAEALDIVIPDAVWQLLGISGGSTVLSTMITKNKKNKQPADPQGVSKHAANLMEGETPESVEQNRDGVLYSNADPKDARFMDMLEGDELASAPYLDVAKVQMFFFTAIALLAYGGVLWQLFSNEATMITEFPTLTPTLVTITGVSHAAYIGTKAVTQTPTNANATVPTSQPPATTDHEDTGEQDH
jgi:hypothetical protein